MLKLNRNFIFLIFATLTLISCDFEDSETFDVDFYVKNNCNEQIKIDYTIRIMSQINGLTFKDFSESINKGGRVELYVRDNISKDANIKGVFFEFDIYKGETKSEYDFWDTNNLQKTTFDNRIEFILNVDTTFFK